MKRGALLAVIARATTATGASVRARSGPASRAASTTVAAVALAVVASGCAASDAAAPWPVRTCRGNNDCGGEEFCELTLRHCLPRTVLAVDLELRPPANTQGWVAQEALALTPRVDDEMELLLEPGVFWRGQVFASDAPGTPLPATLTFWRKSRIAGRPVVQFQASTARTPEPADAAGESVGVSGREGGAFLLPLTRGASYAAVATPNAPFEHSEPCLGRGDPACPSSYPPAYESAVDVADHLQRDLYLDGADRSSLLLGGVLDAAGSALPFSVEIRATGEGQAAGIRSTIGRTCSKAQPTRCRCTPIERCLGDFALALPAGIERYTLRVTPIPTGTTTGGEELVPVVECSAARLGLVALDAAGAPRPLVLPSALRLPPFGAAAPYELRVVGEDGSAVPSAVVSASSEDFAEVVAPAELGRCRAHHRQAAVTDADGRVILLLHPGAGGPRAYDLTVISPARSPWASVHITGIEIAPDGQALAPIRLGPRLLHGGVVRGPAGELVGGALVEATPTAASDVAGAGSVQGSASAVTGSDGSFALLADPGVYDLTIRPESTTSFGRSLSAGEDLTALRPQIELRVPWAVTIGGRVLDANRVGVTGCAVQAFQALTGGQGSTATSSRLAQATAVTGNDGRFTLKLAVSSPLR